MASFPRLFLAVLDAEALPCVRTPSFHRSTGWETSTPGFQQVRLDEPKLDNWPPTHGQVFLDDSWRNSSTVTLGYNGHLGTGKNCPLSPIVRYKRKRSEIHSYRVVFLGVCYTREIHQNKVSRRNSKIHWVKNKNRHIIELLLVIYSVKSTYSNGFYIRIYK